MRRHKFLFPHYYVKVYQNYFNIIILKYLKNNVSLSNKLRQRAYLETILINNKNNINKLQLFCIFTGRIKFTITKFKVSRMIFKDNMVTRSYAGVYKASW